MQLAAKKNNPNDSPPIMINESGLSDEQVLRGYRIVLIDPNSTLMFLTIEERELGYEMFDELVYSIEDDCIYQSKVKKIAEGIIREKIKRIKAELSALDWMDIKNNELEKLGRPPKYAWEYIYSLKQPLRDEINRLEGVLIEEGYMEAPIGKTAEELAAERRGYLDKLQLSRSTFIQLVIYCTSILPEPITLATIKQVSTMSEDADILFNYSNFIVRGTPLLTAVCKQYGVSEDMLDAMFEFSTELLTMKADKVPFDPTLLTNI